MIARRVFGVVLVGLLVAVPAVALAQFNLGLGTNGAPFSMALSPNYPAPNSSATLSFVSASGLDLSNATLSVTVNGASVYQGSVQTIPVAIGAPGALMTINATIKSNGSSYTQSLTVRPEDVALVVEPVSSAPPLYPGRPLVPIGGNVRIVAVANFRTGKGVALDPSQLSYSWTMDGVQLANFSGIGKDVLMAAAPLEYRSRSVSVTIQSQDGSLTGSDSLTLQSAQPTILLYADDPLLGIRFDRALTGSYTLSGTESTLYAGAYSLATNTGTPALQWFVNNTPAQTGPLLTVRPAGQGAGSASISVTGSVGSYTTAVSNLSVLFGTTTSSFLGL